MEDTLRVNMVSLEQKVYPSLNPCFNGRYSQRYAKSEKVDTFISS